MRLALGKEVRSNFFSRPVPLKQIPVDCAPGLERIRINFLEATLGSRHG